MSAGEGCTFRILQGTRVVEGFFARNSGSQRTASSPAQAQTSEEKAGARAAADQGFQAYTQGEWERALDLFQRAESVVHSPVHLLYAARAFSKLGRLIEAKEHYLKVLREQLPPDAPAVVTQAQGEAESELEALEARIPFVSILVQGDVPPPDVRVFMDQQLVPPGLVGVPLPVNPGSHTWYATYHELRSATQTLKVAEGTQETVVLSLRRPKNADLAPAEPARQTSMPHEVEATEPESAASRAWLLPYSFIGFGVGAVGITLGTVFIVKKQSLEDEVDATCKDDLCPGTQENLDKLDDAEAFGTRATISYVVGGLGLAAGVTLVVLSQVEGAPDEHAILSAWAGPGAVGVRGRF